MEIPRELIYEDRKDIKDFGIDEESSLNYLIYEDWLPLLPDLNPFEPGLAKRRLSVFNDAYYICTMVLMHPTNEEFVSYAINRISLHSVVFPLVHLYISMTGMIDRTNLRVLKDIKAGLKSKGWEDNLNELTKFAKAYTRRLPVSEFAPRKLTPELLSKQRWAKVTGGYDKETTKRIVQLLAKNENEWRLMLDAIKDASKLDDDYNSHLNWYFDEEKGVIEEDEPVYKCCDELKEKYDELSMTFGEIQPLATNDEQLLEVNNADCIEIVDGTVEPQKQPETERTAVPLTLTPTPNTASAVVELRFFNPDVYVTCDEQQQLRELLESYTGRGSDKIDVNDARDWFCAYAAYRYCYNEEEKQGEWLRFFTDIDNLLPGRLTKTNPTKTGDARYKRYTQLIAKEARCWYVEQGKLPQLGVLTRDICHVQCKEEDFPRRKRIIQNLFQAFRDLERKIKEEKQGHR